MRLLWEERAWIDYCSWQSESKLVLKRLNLVNKRYSKKPLCGIGKPEPLKGNLCGWWSQRINEEHRIVYTEKDGVIIIASCKGHYEE